MSTGHLLSGFCNLLGPSAATAASLRSSKLRSSKLRSSKLRVALRNCAAWGLLAVCLVLCLPCCSTAADNSLEQTLDTRGTIVLRDASLANWLFAIQEIWSVDLVFGNELQEVKVNGAFKESTLREVLNSILISQNYGYEPVGRSLIIKPLDQLGNRNPQFTGEIIRLKFLSPTEAEMSVRVQLSPHGTVQSIASSKSLYVVDLPDRIAKVRQHLEILENNARDSREQETARDPQAADTQLPATDAAAADSPGGGEPHVQIDTEAVRVIQTQYVNVESLVESVQSLLGTEGRVTPIIDENRLVVIAPESLLRAAEQLVQQVDHPRAQVRITALLYDVNVEEMERLGFNWSHAGRGGTFNNPSSGSLAGLSNSNFALPSAGSSSGSGSSGSGSGSSGGSSTGAAIGSAVGGALGGWLTLSHLSRHFDITAVIQALNTVEGARLLARPNILATDGSQAEFSAVSEIPVQQLTETEAGGSIGTTEFREAGIKLTVTPQVKRDGTVRLAITPEFSVLAGFQAGQPIIDRRSATTILQLSDGETVVIGGLLRRGEIENQRLLPGARKWKYFSRFFRDHDTTVTESELLVVVKAEIIGPEHVRLPREDAVIQMSEQALEEIPYAIHGAFVPPCADPNCPLHNPCRDADFWPHDAICSQHHRVVEKGPVMEAKPGWLETTPEIRQPFSVEAAPSDPALLPSPPRHFPPRDGQAVHRKSFGPPPVVIDETTSQDLAKLKRLAIKRLPAVSVTPIASPAIEATSPVVNESLPPKISARLNSPTPAAAEVPVSHSRETENAAADSSPGPVQRTATRASMLNRIFRF